MSTQQLFDAAAARMLDELPGVERGHMFNSEGLRTGGKFFATASPYGLLLKLPRERVRELAASRAGRPFETGGRVMKEWVVVQPDDDAACDAYLREAHDFVASQRRR
jgi:hypothetical protein